VIRKRKLAHNIDRPIFIIGAPRSGTTILLDILAGNEGVSWISNYVNSAPSETWRSVINRLYDVPIIGKNAYLFKRRTPRVGRFNDRIPTRVASGSGRALGFLGVPFPGIPLQTRYASKEGGT
jgi:hypothetical protein